MASHAPAEQYATLAHQRETANLGMWLFLATEILFFGGLFAAYATYRWSYPEGFAAAGALTKIWLGSINTAVLLTSSFLMTLAIQAAEASRRRPLVIFLSSAALLGLLFMGIKAFEYWQEYQESLVPGIRFAVEDVHARAIELFFLFYFIATGVHAIHLSIGIGLVLGAAARAARGRYLADRSTTIEVIGLYWHFVDIIWIFLFPLIYLMGRS
jgi:cytochrome c oxidase subunit 3